MKKLLFLCMVLSLCIFGCGSGSGTSGSLSVSAPAASGGVVTAIAKFTPASGSALPGQIINFRWYTVGVNTKTQSTEVTKDYPTDGNGSATGQFTLNNNRTESYNVYCIASTDGLTNKEGWQSVLVSP